MLRTLPSRNDQLSGVWEDIMGAGKTLTGAVDEKTAKLESALKVILVLSGIAAATGVIALARGQR
jgi:hypothetical protein